MIEKAFNDFRKKYFNYNQSLDESITQITSTNKEDPEEVPNIFMLIDNHSC